MGGRLCVAGNAVETTRLLLNSKNRRFPHGLANSSGQVGKNYMRHVMAGVVGVMPGEVIEMIDVFPATHNMGAARMGNDPQSSVCNPWGQTHDIENLFISDGSLFPASGCANPTLTIIALALRQADYLSRQIQASLI